MDAFGQFLTLSSLNVNAALTSPTNTNSYNIYSTDPHIFVGRRSPNPFGSPHDPTPVHARPPRLEPLCLCGVCVATKWSLGHDLRGSLDDSVRVDMGAGLTHGSLFSGIGGIDLGFERAGITTRWQVENNAYATKVLEKNFPGTQRYSNIRECHQLPHVDIISGGFPCQPFSIAGKRRGAADDRHLWPEMFRIIQEVKPTWVIAENVPGFVNLFLHTAISDLETAGYETGAIILPACAVEAPHERSRLFIVAHTTSRRRESRRSKCQGQERTSTSIESGTDVADTERCTDRRLYSRRKHQVAPSISTGASQDVAYAKMRESREIQKASSAKGSRNRYELSGNRCGLSYGAGWWTTEPHVGRVAHGVPDRVDRLKCLGNAVVPQLAEAIGRMIVSVECGK